MSDEAYGRQNDDVATAWWQWVPAGRVVRLDGVGADELAVLLEPLPPGCPAVLRYAPAVADATAADHVAYVLAALDQAAVALFPDWLPDAADIAGPQGAGLAAVRLLAFRYAGQSPHFGPFLADRAEHALSGRDPRRHAFPDEVRAAGLARILAASYQRDGAVLLFDLPAGLSATHERAIVSAAGWLAHHGGFAVWLSGAPLAWVDSIDTVTVGFPRPAPPADDEAAVAKRPSVGYPPPPGRPRSDSAAEQALEALLATRDWAAGRRWNETYQSSALTESYRLDLVWHAYRCVVEIDGPDHLQPTKYEADRRRDVRLQLDGYAVLRFTNRQVLTDVSAVASQIQQFLSLRPPWEGTSDDEP